MTVTISRRLVDLAVVNTLTAGTDRPGALVEGPTTVGSETLADLFPYFYVMPMPGAVYDEMFSNLWNIADLTYVVESCGQNVEQAEWMRDKVAEVMLDNLTYPMTATGISVMGRRPDGGPDSPEKQGNNFWTVSEAFRIQVTTA